MPPIMGAAAFLLAGESWVAFTDVIMRRDRATLLLYFFSLFILRRSRSGRAASMRWKKAAPAAVLPRCNARLVSSLLPFRCPARPASLPTPQRPETARSNAVGVLLPASRWCAPTRGGRIGFARSRRQHSRAPGKASVEISHHLRRGRDQSRVVLALSLSFSMNFLLVQIRQTSLFLLLLMTGR